MHPIPASTRVDSGYMTQERDKTRVLCMRTRPASGRDGSVIHLFSTSSKQEALPLRTRSNDLIRGTLSLKGVLLSISDASGLRGPVQTYSHVEANQVQPCMSDGSKSHRR